VATGTWRRSEQQRLHRGWDDQTWQDAAKCGRGRDLHEVEVLTDRLGAPAYSALNRAEGVELARILEPVALAASKQLPYPNAMGLPRPEREERREPSVQ